MKLLVFCIARSHSMNFVLRLICLCVFCFCSELHEHFPVVPEPIREYIDEVRFNLEALTNYDGPDLSLDDKLNFLRETRHAFGRTALVLSGGGALGAFHIVRLTLSSPLDIAAG